MNLRWEQRQWKKTGTFNACTAFSLLRDGVNDVELLATIHTPSKRRNSFTVDQSSNFPSMETATAHALEKARRRLLSQISDIQRDLLRLDGPK